MKKRLKKAFTITELVIVIAVIAVLAAVLIPTFASVVKSANKSADETYLKNISDTIGNYAAAHNGEAPKDYPEMMEALAENELCDPANPYLLATKLKEDNVRMVWFPNTTKVQLIDTSRETLLWQTGATRGMGNYALVGTVFEDSEGKQNDGLVGSGCYVLCVKGDKNCEIAADLYYNFYVTCNGDVDKFEPNVDGMSDKGWANCIKLAAKNAKAGYHNDDKVQEDLVSELQSSSTATIDVKDEKEALSALATIATLANDAATKDDLKGKSIKLNIPDSLKNGNNGTGIDAKDITLAAIGNSYRKEPNVMGGTPESTVSVDYNDLKLKNVKVPQNYVSSGAEYQTADDSGHKKGGYAFTYGMFGSIIAAPGETVTIENLHIEGVDMDFTGSSETINGKKVETFADNAGIIAGYVQGDVVFRNITINGNTASGAKGKIIGYDAIAGVVGRAYGQVVDGQRKDSVLKLEKVEVSNLTIQGERRASGFVGYYGNKMSVEISNCKLTNVDIIAKRNDQNTKNECWAMVFTHVGNSPNALALKVSDIELNNVTTSVDFNGKKIDEVTADILKPAAYIHVDENPCVKSSARVSDNKHLLLVAAANSSTQVTLNNITFKGGDAEKKYAGSTTTAVKASALSLT